MIKIGEYQTLTIAYQKPQGFYLKDDENNNVLLPNAYITSDMKIEDDIEVFVYSDGSGIDVATTETPKLTVGQFACLEIVGISYAGAFADWGLQKDLLIPFSNQKGKLREEQKVIVFLYLDAESEKLVGTTKINRYLQLEANGELEKGQEVDLIVYAKTDLGYKVIINQKYGGLVYDNEVPNPLFHGEELKGYIKPLREDGLIDVSVARLGHKSIEPNADNILQKLERNRGYLPYHDKSDPEEIRVEFGISKKAFKKSLGLLYKQKIITIKPDGIYLN